MSDTYQSFLKKLRQLIASRFNEGELDQLCFELDVAHEDLPGEGHGVKVIELIALMERSNRLPELVEMVSILRPQANWPELPDELAAAPWSQSKTIPWMSFLLVAPCLIQNRS